MAGCVECTSSACTACLAPHLELIDANTCRPRHRCGTGSFADNGSCLGCHGHCRECFGPSNSECLSCQPDSRRNGTACIFGTGSRQLSEQAAIESICTSVVLTIVGLALLLLFTKTFRFSPHKMTALRAAPVAGLSSQIPRDPAHIPHH